MGVNAGDKIRKFGDTLLISLLRTYLCGWNIG
jgi:hypothetical protein